MSEADSLTEVLETVSASPFKTVVGVLAALLRSRGHTRHPASGVEDTGATLVALDLLLKYDFERTVTDWVMNQARHTCAREIKTVTQAQYRLHFSASKARTAIIGEFRLDKLATIFKTIAPHTWGIVQVLLDANGEARRRATPADDSILYEKRHELEEIDEVENGAGIVVGDDNSEAESDIEDELLRKEMARAKGKRHTERRNRALLEIKSVTVLSILANSTNQKCNAFQATQGFFLDSTNTPERVVKVLAHTGWSVSSSSILMMIRSVTEERRAELRSLSKPGLFAIAYDNLDFDFKTKEPNDQNQGMFSSITTGTYIPLTHGTTLDDIKYSKELWDSSPLNPIGPSDSTPPVPPAREYLIDSLRAVQRRVPSTEEWYIRKILVDKHLSKRFTKHLGPMPSSLSIPITKTDQQPARAMHLKASSNDDNISIVENMERQVNTPANWYRSYVRLCHGDLGTLERHDTTTESRAIESSEKDRLQWLITVPGAFHIRMACVDAIWRVHIHPKAQRDIKGGIFDLFKVLRPKDSSKLALHPTYRMMNDGIHHLIESEILVCWERITGCSDINDFINGNPTWEQILSFSEAICDQHIARSSFERNRFASSDRRDLFDENSMLFRRDGMWYCMLAHAMNTGQVGTMEDLLWLWVPMFQGCGKHKYAAHLGKFLRDLRSVYPPRLSHVIRLHWLCNPTGTAEGFRGVDWLVERNNLYTKVIFSGSNSNRTLTHIINQSSLIEVYRLVHLNIEDNFYIKHRSTKHAAPRLEIMLQRIRTMIRQPKRATDVETLNVLDKGMGEYSGGLDVQIGDDEEVEKMVEGTQGILLVEEDFLDP